MPPDNASRPRSAEESASLRYVGTDRRGVANEGFIVGDWFDLPAWTESMHKKGFRDLTVTDTDGKVVAKIQDNDTGREWWVDPEYRSGRA